MTAVWRWVGAMLLVGGLGGVGWLRVAALNGRVRELVELRRAVAALRTGVAHTRPPAERAFASAAEGCTGVVAQTLREAARRVGASPGVAAGEAWLWAYRRRRHESFLAAEDLAVLRDLCRTFGRVDSQTQLVALDEALARLDAAAARAAEERDRLGRLSGFSGVAAGLALAILLS